MKNFKDILEVKLNNIESNINTNNKLIDVLDHVNLKYHSMPNTYSDRFGHKLKEGDMIIYADTDDRDEPILQVGIITAFEKGEYCRVKSYKNDFEEDETHSANYCTSLLINEQDFYKLFKK